VLTSQAFEAGVRGTPEAPGMADGSRGLSSSTAQGASVASTVTIASPTSSAPMWRLLIHCQNVELAAVGQNELPSRTITAGASVWVANTCPKGSATGSGTRSRSQS
jgi:hypothetical protein